MKPQKTNKKFIVILVLMVISCLISWNLYFKEYAQKDTISIHAFPKTMGEWTSEEIPITDEEYAILETRNAFTRRYTTASGKTVYLFIVYSQNNRKVSHPPEICYTGGGISVLRNTVKDLTQAAGISVNQLLLQKNDYQQSAYYWFKVGNTFLASYWKQQLLIALKTLINQPASSAMIRVSSTLNKETPAQTEDVMTEFTQLILPLIPKYLP
jgi:EpsI family protein